MAEKDYVALAKQRIIRPADQQKLPRILVYGRNKKGKTTFSLSAGVENTLIADPETGTAYMNGLNPNVWPITQWTDLEEMYGYLRLGKHPYKWVALDGLSRFSDMALDYVMNVRNERQIDAKPGMVDRRDWGQSGKLMKTMLINFYNLKGVGVIYTAQERSMENEAAEADDDVEDESTAFVADLPRGVRGTVNSLADVIGRIYVVRTEIAGKEVKQRRLWLGEHPMYDTGARSEHMLPDYLKNPTVPRLLQLIEEGRVTRPARRSA
jgi:hypothetical protein